MKIREYSDRTAFETALSDRLREYGASDYYPLHMPGHKRRMYGNMPEELFRMDITEIEGFDNLHQPEGVLLRMQEHASQLYGSQESYYLINGSTGGILSAVSAALPRGGHICMSRNCHKSAYHACYLRNLTISYLYPSLMGEYDICEAITPKQVEKALEEEKDIDAVLIVSPTYEGRIADIEAIARIVHARGIPLIVDEAHGAHLGFHESFAQSSCRLGADIVIHSVHKTLPSMTQTALLHVNGAFIDRDRLRRFLHIYQSSSPSYILMASIENALLQVEKCGREIFAEFIHNWQEMNSMLSTCRHLKILPCVEKKQDIGKLLVSVKKTGLSGRQLYDMLLQEYHLQLEMAAPTYVLAMFTVGDMREGFIRTAKALLEIDSRLRASEEDAEDAFSEMRIVPPSAVLPFYQAWDMQKVWCPLEQCQGQIAGEFLNLYPPGTPMVVPGERISKSLLAQVRDCLDRGFSVQGLKQEGGKTFLQVIKQ